MSTSTDPPSTIRVDTTNTSTGILHRSKNPIPITTEWNIDTTMETDTATTTTILASPPDIDKVIQGFQHELDTLSRSFDLLASSHSATRRSAQSRSIARTPTTASEFARSRPPPPTAQPQGRRNNNIGHNNNNDSKESSSIHRYNSNPEADETVLTQTTTKTPRPVETPVPSTSSNNTASRRFRTYAEIPATEIRECNLFPSSTTTTSSTNNNKKNSNHVHNNDRELKGSLQAMREIMNEQSATILELKRENNRLRKQLLARETPVTCSTSTTRARERPIYDSSNRHRNSDARYSDNIGGRNHYYYDNDSTTPRPQRQDRNYNHNNRTSNNNHFYYDDEMKPTVSSLTTIPREDDEEDDENTLETVGNASSQRGFTPGTKFVAELSKFMAIQPGHSVPLSVIIDRNWDKLKHHMREETRSADL